MINVYERMYMYKMNYYHAKYQLNINVLLIIYKMNTDESNIT